MYKFPKNLYTDVRIEKVCETDIHLTQGNLDEFKVRRNRAAFIRVFDGDMWYYSSISDTGKIQKEINRLASIAKSSNSINDHPVVRRLQVNKAQCIKFNKDDVALISEKKKFGLLKHYSSLVKSRDRIRMWSAGYRDAREIKEFYSSTGAELMFDVQRAGFILFVSLVYKGKRHSDFYLQGSNHFSNLNGYEKELKKFLTKCEDFVKFSKPVKPGRYAVILSPQAAGIFAHESFGHKSESDFIIGDESAKKNWVLGKKVGSDVLSIVDDGMKPGMGYTPFDDEGTKAEKTYLIKNGLLTGRLHSAETAAVLDEDLTGNARAINFEYQPIVRMTTTYILPTKQVKKQLLSEVDEGIYVDKVSHGSGMSTFTLAPRRSYMIKNGKVANPVNISVITGNVFETLGEIDGVSDKTEIIGFVGGGCGKGGQSGLCVGFGGPYVRVRSMNVQ